MNTKPKSRTDNLVTMNLENESLIYDLNNNRAYCLNETSAMVWGNCDGKTSTAEISILLSQEFNTSVSEDLVWLALDELKKNNLLENGEILSNYFPNLSRREIVKKVGLASMVALPIISSVVAPSAVMAASCSFPGLIAPGDIFTILNPTNVFCSDVGSLATPAFCESRGLSFCRSCTARYSADCINRASDSFFSCTCV